MVIFLILLNAAALIFLSKKYPGVALAYFLFFQGIPLVLFDKIGNPKLRFAFFSIFLVIFVIINFKNTISLRTLILRIKNPVSVSIILFSLMLIVQYLSWESFYYVDIDFVQKYLITYFPLFFLILIFLTNDRILIEIGIGIIIFGFILFIFLIFIADLKSLYLYERMEIKELTETNPIALARLFGLVTISNLLYFYFYRGWIRNIIFSISFPSSLYIILFSGTRQIFLALLFVCIFYLFVSKGLNIKARIRFSYVISILAITLFGLFHSFEFITLERLADLKYFDQSLRYERYSFGLELISETPLLGFGAGSFERLSGMGHAHNLILGLITEFGVFGIIISILMVGCGSFYCLKLLRSHGASYQTDAFCLMWIMWLISSMVSGGSGGSRQFWVLSGIIVILWESGNFKSKEVPSTLLK